MLDSFFILINISKVLGSNGGAVSISDTIISLLGEKQSVQLLVTTQEHKQCPRAYQIENRFQLPKSQVVYENDRIILQILGYFGNLRFIPNLT